MALRWVLQSVQGELKKLKKTNEEQKQLIASLEEDLDSAALKPLESQFGTCTCRAVAAPGCK